jgi:hypothetical protein
MPSFVNIQYSNEHPGVTRLAAAFDGAMALRKSWSATRGLVALLLTAVLAAALVVAYEVMDSLVEGHLLVLWIALWAVGFASLALVSGTVTRVALAGRSYLDGLAASQAKTRADQRLWRMAQSDPRVMADLQVAISRQGALASTVLTKRALRLGSADLQAFIRQMR